MNWILEPIGYSCIGDSQKCFLRAWAKTTLFDVLLKKKKKKRKTNYGIIAKKSGSICLKKLNIKFYANLILKD